MHDPEIDSPMRANVRLILPSFNKLVINYEKCEYIFCEMFYDYIGINDFFEGKDITILDQIIKSFDFLDSVLNEENIEVAGKDLTEKYEFIKKETDYEIVFSQIYRILIAFRNAKVHDSKSILIDKDNISVVRRDRKGKDIKLVVKKELINYILSYAIYYKNVQNLRINEYYKINIALWYYLNIEPLVLKYIDHGNRIDLIPIKSRTFFAGINSRYVCENIHYEKLDGYIKLCINPSYLYSTNQNNNLIDFIFDIDEKYFMVPYEIVQNGKIKISELKIFEFKYDIQKYLDYFYNGLIIKNNLL